MADGAGLPTLFRAPHNAKMDDILAEGKETFTDAATAESENRFDALDDVRFARLGDQWPAEVRRRREMDNRPCQTINVLPTYIRQVVNDGRQNRPQITVRPVGDGADDEVADIYNGLIKNIESTSDADVAYDTALDSAVTHGWGYFRINIEYASDDSFLLDLKIDPVFDPFSIYADPHNQGADSADWNQCHVTERMKKDDFEDKYKGADAIDWEGSYNTMGSPWVEEDTVLLCEYWKREEVVKTIVMMSNGVAMDIQTVKKNLDLFRAMGLEPTGQTRPTKSHKVTQYLMTGAEVLECTPWPGKYIPIIPCYGEVVNLEGKRYLRGLVRDAKDSQQSINFMRTAAVEAVGYAPKAPFIGPKGAFATDADKWETANVESHAYIEYDGATAPERVAFPAPPAGYIQAATDAANDLKSVIGMFQASLGQPSNETSGRAILARMREGDVSTFHYVDNLARAIRHAGRVLIDLIPKVYSVPRMVRTLKPDGTSQQTPINQPTQQPQMLPNGQPQMQPVMGAMGQPVPGPDGNPLMQPVIVEKVFDLSVGKYDLAVEAGPSFTTRREEAANQMIELARADPAILPIIGDILVKNLDWPGADEIADRLTQARQQQQQQPPQGKNPQAEAQAQMAQVQAQHQVDLQKLQQEMQLEQQKMQMQMEIERQKMMLQAQLAQQKAEFDAQLAEQSMRISGTIKLAEAKARSDQTVQIPDVTPGGGVG